MTRLGVQCVVLATLAGAGCATNPEVKRASTQMTQALAALDGSKEDFKKSLLAEIDATRNQVARAMVARAVRARIDQAVASLEAKGDLIGLSDEIDATEQSVGRMVDQFKAIQVSANPSPADVEGAIRGALDERVKALDRTIEILGPVPGSTVVALRRQRAILDSWRNPGPIHDDLETLVRLAGVRAYVEGRLLAQFDTHVRVLRMVQAAADGWIQTDVVVDGAKAAIVVQDANQLLNGFMQ